MQKVRFLLFSTPQFHLIDGDLTMGFSCFLGDLFPAGVPAPDGGWEPVGGDPPPLGGEGEGGMGLPLAWKIQE